MKFVFFLILGVSSTFAQATVSYLKGKAFYTPANSLESKELVLNQTLNGGDQVRTTAASALSISLDKNVLIKVHADSKFLIPRAKSNSQSKKMRLELYFGSLWFQVKNLLEGESFEVKTPTATAGVRGTEFSVSYNQESKISETAVFDGSVFTSNLLGELKILEEGMISRIQEDIHELVQEELKILDRVLDFKRIPVDSGKKALQESQNELKEMELDLKKMEQNLEQGFKEQHQNLMKRLNHYKQELMRDLQLMEKKILEDAKKFEENMIKQGENLQKELLKQSEDFQKNLMQNLKDAGIPGLGNGKDDDDDDDDDWDMGTDEGSFLDDSD